MKGEGALLLLAPKGKGGGMSKGMGMKDEPDGDESSGGDDEKVAAAEDAIAALKAGDAEGFAEALSQIVGICMDEYG